MNTLNDRIIFSFSEQDVTGHTAGMYVYSLKRGSDIVFTGNFYYNGTDTSVDFDMTDIIMSDGSVIKEDDFLNVQSSHTKLANRYHVSITWGVGSTSTSMAYWVAKVYKYPNRELGGDACFFNANTYEDNVSITLQGFGFNDDSILIPHYPMYADRFKQAVNNCPFGLSLMVGGDISQVVGMFEVQSILRQTNIATTGGTNTFTSTCGGVANHDSNIYRNGVFSVTNGRNVIRVRDTNQNITWLYVRYPASDIEGGEYPYAYAYVEGSVNVPADDEDTDYNIFDGNDLVFTKSMYPVSGDTSIALYDGNTVYPIEDTYNWGTYDYKAAIFDVCPKKYYLFWQDRYGSFQCQGFNDYAKYSETFNKTEVQDYRNRRRNANIQVQSKWQLNSGWITEDLYPYYESIYTSPILILFDTEQNKRFSVMVSGDYLEKTYKNQKKMINMNLELQENKTQNMIY